MAILFLTKQFLENKMEMYLKSFLLKLLNFWRWTNPESGWKKINVSLSNANGHITLNTPVLVRSLKLSNVESSQYLDGWPPGNTGCCWLLFFVLFTHFSPSILIHFLGKPCIAVSQGSAHFPINLLQKMVYQSFWNPIAKFKVPRVLIIWQTQKYQKNIPKKFRKKSLENPYKNLF